MNRSNEFDSLVEIMEKLRGEEGCAWDREQDHNSLKPHLIEESYETIEAIDGGDPAKLKEELGDLLFQIIFHSRIAEESGNFSVYDVIESIREKMIRRHPHVFGNTSVSGPDEALKQWEEIKSREKGYEERRSLLDGVPKRLPSLLRAHRIQDRAARVGFDWNHVDQVFAKVEEEMEEFRDAFSRREPAQMEAELGDLFFALVNIARFIEINPEDALRKTINRFTRRFAFIEQRLEQEGKRISSASFEEMETLWNKAKEREREEIKNYKLKTKN